MSALVRWCTMELLIVGKIRGDALLSFKGRDVSLKNSQWSVVSYLGSLWDRRICGDDRTATVRELKQLIERSVDLCRLLFRSSFLQQQTRGGPSTRATAANAGVANFGDVSSAAPVASSVAADPTRIQLDIMSEEISMLGEMCSAMRKCTEGLSALSMHYTIEKDTRISMELDQLVRNVEKTLGWCLPEIEELKRFVHACSSRQNGGSNSQTAGARRADGVGSSETGASQCMTPPMRAPPPSAASLYAPTVGGAPGGPPIPLRATSRPIDIASPYSPSEHSGACVADTANARDTRLVGGGTVIAGGGRGEPGGNISISPSYTTVGSVQSVRSIPSPGTSFSPRSRANQENLNHLFGSLLSSHAHALSRSPTSVSPSAVSPPRAAKVAPENENDISGSTDTPFSFEERDEDLAAVHDSGGGCVSKPRRDRNRDDDSPRLSSSSPLSVDAAAFVPDDPNQNEHGERKSLLH